MTAPIFFVREPQNGLLKSNKYTNGSSIESKERGRWEKCGCDVIYKLDWKLEVSTSYLTKYDLFSKHFE